jgi:O-succinylbenzoic acid--CoA ligase
MPEVTVERIAEKLPWLKLVNCYGATETTSPAVFMPPEEAVARKEYVGLAVPCGHIVVMDFDGVEVPPGAPGEIHIGGAMVVPGYFNNPEATAREFKSGYWKSGDLGIMDAQGYLRVIDRIKDVINRGGYKIFASEVENVLLDHPAVVEVAVVAKPCPVLGERVHAFVVTRHVIDDSELAHHCANLLSDYKVPEAFHHLGGGLPRNANGKVLKRELRERLAAA